MKKTLLILSLIFTTGTFAQYTQVFDTIYSSSTQKSEVLDVKIDENGYTYELIRLIGSTDSVELIKRNSTLSN